MPPQEAIDYFNYLKYGLAAVLAFIGIKMILSYWVIIPTHLSLIVVASLIALSITVSLLAVRNAD